MKRIVFVTKSETNYRIAKRYLNESKITLTRWSSTETIPRGDNLQDTVSKKALAAYEKVQEPCFVMEGSFMIEALNQFPGIHTQYVVNTIGTKGILKLMEGISNRNCVYRRCLCFYDGSELRYFFSDEKGSIVLNQTDTYEKDKVDSIFIPESYQNKSKESKAYQPNCIEQFAHYLNNHISSLMEDPYHED